MGGNDQAFSQSWGCLPSGKRFDMDQVSKSRYSFILSADCYFEIHSLSGMAMLLCCLFVLYL